MNKAQPDPSTIWVIANGSLENANCQLCETRIFRCFGADRQPLPWTHIHAGRIRCTEKKESKK